VSKDMARGRVRKRRNAGATRSTRGHVPQGDVEGDVELGGATDDFVVGEPAP
jgi:hypothetical protein